MGGGSGCGTSEGASESEEFVYRISTAEEWETMQRTGSNFGGELDNSDGFIHLSKLHQARLALGASDAKARALLKASRLALVQAQLLRLEEPCIWGAPLTTMDIYKVQSTLQNFFLNTKRDLYLLQIDTKMLGDGLVYEVVDGSNVFPHFYGPSRSYSPLPLDAVTKAEKLTLSGSQFSCSLLN